MKYPEVEINIQGEDQILNRRNLKTYLVEARRTGVCVFAEIDTLPHTFVSDDEDLKEEKNICILLVNSRPGRMCMEGWL